jgi:hypothetical protein
VAGDDGRECSAFAPDDLFRMQISNSEITKGLETVIASQRVAMM